MSKAMGMENYGREMAYEYKRILNPQELNKKLAEYKEVFGSEFTITEMLKIYDIQSKLHIAAALYDLPEQLLQEVYEMRQATPDTIQSAIENLASAVEGLQEE